MKKENNYGGIAVAISIFVGLPVIFLIIYMFPVIHFAIIGFVIVIIVVIGVFGLFSTFSKIKLLTRQTWEFSEEYSNLFKRGEYDKAIALCNKALEKDPENIIIFNDLDKVYLATGNYEKSIEINKHILKKFQHESRHWYNLANAYHKSGDFDKALESIDQALKISPVDHFSLLLREQILNRKKKNNN